MCSGALRRPTGGGCWRFGFKDTLIRFMPGVRPCLVRDVGTVAKQFGDAGNGVRLAGFGIDLRLELRHFDGNTLSDAGTFVDHQGDRLSFDGGARLQVLQRGCFGHL